MQASIEDVAEQAGVSITTVSRAFRHPDLVAAATRERVLSAARSLDFSISRSASLLQTGQTHRVALLINDRSSSWFNAHVYEGLSEVLQPLGYDMVFYQVSSSAQRRSFFEELPIRRNVDAVVVASFDIEGREVERLKTMHVPVAGINAIPPAAFDVSVGIDDEEAMRRVARHLISLGHRRIAFLTFPNESEGANALHFSASLRAKGFITECERAGVEPNIITVPEGEGAIDSALNQLFALASMPTAICCEQDSLAAPLFSRLQGFGYRVPEDVSITGFDDIDIARQIGLTTVRQDPAAMGRLVGTSLAQAMGEGEPASDTSTPAALPSTYEATIIFRNSTKPPKNR